MFMICCLWLWHFRCATAKQLLKGTQHFKKHTFLKNKIKNSKLTSPYAIYGCVPIYILLSRLACNKIYSTQMSLI